MCVTVLTGKQIRIKRIELDFNLSRFARTLNVSKTWLSLVETGKESGLPLRTKATLYFHQRENAGRKPCGDVIQTVYV